MGYIYTLDDEAWAPPEALPDTPLPNGALQDYKPPFPISVPSSPIGQLAKVLEGLSAYSCPPARLQKMQPEIYNQSRDVFGLTDRLSAIQEVLGARNLGQLVDLGGNSGFFCLSLVDSGTASRSAVYDVNIRALSAGRAMAQALGLDKRIEFVGQKVDLNFVRSMPCADTVLCLNLMHHAGTNFDADEVACSGWECYTEHWLAEFRKKFRLAIVSLGFKGQKPRYWDVHPSQRPSRFYEMANRHGWSVLYDANVEDIRSLGVARSNGLHTTVGSIRRRLIRLNRFLSKAHRDPGAEKRRKYHLYILE
jgi:hypothetical protein